MSKAATRPEVTGWFDSSVDPERSGVYEVEWVRGATRFARFDGRGPIGWRTGARTADAASAQRTNAGWKPLRWRGLAQDPKAAA